MGQYPEVSLCACALRNMLSFRTTRKCRKPVLCHSESVWAGGLLLWLFHPRDLEGWILYDYLAGFPASGTAAQAGKALAAQALLLWCNRGIYLLLCASAKRDVCDGHPAAALSELDL